jgi:hypothetical protein
MVTISSRIRKGLFVLNEDEGLAVIIFLHITEQAK